MPFAVVPEPETDYERILYEIRQVLIKEPEPFCIPSFCDNCETIWLGMYLNSRYYRFVQFYDSVKRNHWTVETFAF